MSKGTFQEPSFTSKDHAIAGAVQDILDGQLNKESVMVYGKKCSDTVSSGESIACSTAPLGPDPPTQTGPIDILQVVWWREL